MNLLTSTLYDPSSAVTNKATSSLLAMTAFDTTNLRLNVTVPAHGKVLFRLQCTVTGATTVPAVLLGVLTGATVVGRVSPREIGVASITTSLVQFFAEFTATGLTPGAANFDAAYAVQVVVASTNIKYGGPNNNSGANAWGGFLFEAWDPQPLPAAGIAGTTFPTTIPSTTQIATGVWQDTTSGDFTTASSIGKSLFTSGNAPGAASGLALVGSNMGTITGALTAAQIATGVWQDTTAGDFTTALSVGKSVMNGVALGTGLTVANLTNAPTSGDLTATMKTSVTTAATAATPTIAAASTITSVSGAVGSVTGNVGGNVTGSVGSVAGAVASVTARVTANTDQFAGKGLTAAAGVLSVVFPGELASRTNITAGFVTTDHLVSNASGGVSSAVNLRAIVDQLTRGQIVTGSGSTTTSLIPTFLGNVASSVALSIGVVDQLKGRRITFAVDANTSGLAGFTTVITASTNATPPVLTVSPALPVAPTGALDTFLLDSALADIAEIAGQTVSAAGAVTFPTDPIASTTNITGGTITTVTNLTNAPTSGDLTATMKTSVTTAATAATPTAAAVTGNVGGNVVGSVGSVVGAVGSVTARVTANSDQIAGSATAATNSAAVASAVGRGIVTTGATTTSIPTSSMVPAGAVLGQFGNNINPTTMVFDGNTTTLALRGQKTVISSSTNAANPTFTVNPLTTAPVAGDVFSVT